MFDLCNTISRILSIANKLLWGNCTLALIIAAALFLSVKMRFFPAFHPVKALRCTLLAKKQSGERSEFSCFRALSTALGASMGTGNITGVAAAISIGGCGAVFWMILSSFIVMALAYAENVLGVYYKNSGYTIRISTAAPKSAAVHCSTLIKE
jgi:AGCS family alanine or glycine:cation symporter